LQTIFTQSDFVAKNKELFEFYISDNFVIELKSSYKIVAMLGAQTASLHRSNDSDER
jgi:hypothetical protein